jgi:predicted nucleotide-binding protein
MNKLQESSLIKINILINELEQLEYYDDIIKNEYMKWNEKSLRYLSRIFGENSEQSYKFVDIQFECNNNYGDCTHLETFICAKKAMKSLLEVFIEEIQELDEVEQVLNKENNLKIDKSKVFVVHGHDSGLMNEIARFIEKLDFEPIILDEQVSNGMSILDKIEKYSNVGFAIVLYTECDIGGKDKETLQSRARQNVVFEHGYLNARIGRENVVVLIKGDVEKPNDISGLVYIKTSDNWKIKLSREMQESGYNIDMNKIS